MAFKCCRDCVAPKRHEACHGDCPEYAAEKAEYDRLKAKDDNRRKVKNAIYNQRSINVAKALKKHGRYKNGK